MLDDNRLGGYLRGTSSLWGGGCNEYIIDKVLYYRIVDNWVTVFILANSDCINTPYTLGLRYLPFGITRRWCFLIPATLGRRSPKYKPRILRIVGILDNIKGPFYDLMLKVINSLSRVKR